MDIPMFNTLCLSCTQIVFRSVFSKKNIFLFWKLPTNWDLCQIREPPRFRLKSDGTISLFSRNFRGERGTGPLMAMSFLCFQFVTSQKYQKCWWFQPRLETPFSSEVRAQILLSRAQVTPVHSQRTLQQNNDGSGSLVWVMIFQSIKNYIIFDLSLYLFFHS